MTRNEAANILRNDDAYDFRTVRLARSVNPEAAAQIDAQVHSHTNCSDAMSKIMDKVASGQMSAKEGAAAMKAIRN
jgi:hypothetical protein